MEFITYLLGKGDLKQSISGFGVFNTQEPPLLFALSWITPQFLLQAVQGQLTHGLSPCFPEELDTLIGDKSEKLRSSLLSCSPTGAAAASLSRQMAAQSHSLCEPPLSSGIPQGFHGIHAPPAALHAKSPLPALLGGQQQPGCYTSPQGFPQIPTALMQHTPDPQSLFPAGEAQRQLRTQPSIPQDSPVPAQSPPSCGMKMLPEHSPARTVQDTLLQEGDLSNDIDALNPSLTDFDLQGRCVRCFYLGESGLLHPIPSHPIPHKIHFWPFFFFFLHLFTNSTFLGYILYKHQAILL